MTWVHVALAVLVTIIVLVIAVSRSYALGRGVRRTRTRWRDRGAIPARCSAPTCRCARRNRGSSTSCRPRWIVCDGNGSVRCSSKSQVNVDVIENGWIVKDEILDILHVVVENGGVREREMCVSLDLTRMSSAIPDEVSPPAAPRPPTSYLRVRVGPYLRRSVRGVHQRVTEQRRFERMRRDFVTNRLPRAEDPRRRDLAARRNRLRRGG